MTPISPRRVVLAERLVALLGVVLMLAAIATVDWRAGLFLAGLALLASAVDVRWPRR